MVVFTTKGKKKKKRPIKVLFERKKHNLKSFTSHHLVPFRNIHSAERICKEQNQLFSLCSETGVLAMTVCLLHRGLMIYLQTERKENARQHQRCKNTRSTFTACLLVHSEEYLSRLGETCTVLPLVAEPGDTWFLLMRFGGWFLRVHVASFAIRNAVWFPPSLPAAAVVLCLD